MEGREVLRLPSTFEDLLFPPHTELKEEDYCSTIKPEDMLVPLSELQPPRTPASPPLASTPPVSPPSVPVSPAPAPATPAPAGSPIPKIIICRKVATSALKNKPAQVHYQVMPVKQVPQVTPGTPLLLHSAPQIPSMSSGKCHEGQVAVMHLGGRYEEPQVSDMAMTLSQSAPRTQVQQTCDAEELINEMVQMIGSSSSGDFQDMESAGFDSSMMEASMYDLLSQLETSDPDSTILEGSEPDTTILEVSEQENTILEASEPDTTILDSEPHSPSSPASVLTSLPSESPFSLSVPSPHHSESSFSVSVTSPHPSEFPLPPSPISLPSPVPSIGSLSPAQSSSESLFPCSEASRDSECLEEEWSPLEETHSYSRSQRKARPSRRTPSARKTPYPEDRKERKKEQNKQAALRYRQKKKQEEDDMMSKVRKEEERQQKLKSTYVGLKQELSYLKKIMREVFITRGMLSEEALKKAALEKRSRSSK